MLLKLAWRNIWRNKRRTLLTVSAVAFAVFFSSFMNSFQKGAWDHMMNSVINSYFGFGQIHAKGYWEEQSLDKAFEYQKVVKAEDDVDGIEGIVPRVESFALASFDKFTKVGFVIGTSPEAEDKMTQLSQRIPQGSYFSENEKAVLVGIGVADKLKMSVGDTLVLLGQGYHGVNAAGKFLVKGFLDFPSPDLDKRMIYMPLNTAQEFYGTEGRITTLVLDMKDKDVAEPILQSLKSTLDTSNMKS